VRPDEIKGLKPVEDHEYDTTLVHVFSLEPGLVRRQRHVPHISRHHRTC
jgi:hypothetical protein